MALTLSWGVPFSCSRSLSESLRISLSIDSPSYGYFLADVMIVWTAGELVPVPPSFDSSMTSDSISFSSLSVKSELSSSSRLSSSEISAIFPCVVCMKCICSSSISCWRSICSSLDHLASSIEISSISVPYRIAFLALEEVEDAVSAACACLACSSRSFSSRMMMEQCLRMTLWAWRVSLCTFCSM